MTTKDEALRLALEWIEAQPEPRMIGAAKVVQSLRAALAQKDEQEPALWKLILRSDPGHFGYYTEHPSKFGIDMSSEKYEWTLFYTAPPKRQPLTDVQISHIWDRHIAPVFGKNGINPVVFARAIEAAHGIGAEHEPR